MILLYNCEEGKLNFLILLKIVKLEIQKSKLKKGENHFLLLNFYFLLYLLF